MITLPALALALCAPAAGASLSGSVRGSVDGAPVADAFVVAYDLRLAYHYTLTAADGSWTLDDLPAGAWRLRALPASTDDHVPRFWPATRDFCTATLVWVGEDERRDGLDFALERGATASGTLLDQAGQPVAYAVVTAEGADATVTGVSREATSDAEGRFTLRGLDVVAGDVTEWRCAVEAEGWPAQYVGEVAAYAQEDAATFTAAAGQDTALGTLRLLDGILLGGRVDGPDGPVAGATVYAYSSSQITTVSTDGDGRYEAVGLPPGSTLVWAAAKGLATTYYPDADRPLELVDVLDEGAVRDDLDLAAPWEAVLEARFPGAADGVRLMLYNSTYTVGRGTATDADGVARIDGLHGGEYTLFAWGYGDDLVNRWTEEVGGEPVPFTLPAAAQTTIEVQLEPGARVSGVLRDDYGAPIYGGAVFVTPVGGEDTWSTSTDHDGAWTLGGLPAGAWLIEASYGPYCDTDPGYVPVVWPGEPNATLAESLALAAGEHRPDVDLELPRDDDHDGMGDRWEASWGLDTDRDDSAEDPDGDGYTNLEEYLLGTDPLEADAGAGGGCGCAGVPASPRPWVLPAVAVGLLARRRRRA